ncbi:glycosyltransferase involved in cell wall biosynthesis [Pedobacter sp. AK017]|uniref:glycosyltransferase n=1 Tax=Pedobacter sp. AK017 TaxID=2723073 RepID=UPI001616C26D|nr:glycosyltransferase [Pedobacter sp. AK017]MBB5436363.1 glycosyltransferase involved in cell wall biosynthesis [Pedobacter sp. AK017]
MTQNSNLHISEVTLLITHFNRSESLQRLLNTLNSYKISFDEVIVSDGGSREEHLSAVIKLQQEFGFTLLTSETNKGLGNTINVGQDAVKTPYILYIQEDFVPKAALGQALIDGLEIMKNESQWDIVRFYSFPWAPFPYLKPYKSGFSEMKFSLWPWYISHIKFYVYSDHPHLKRRSYPEKFGRYIESPKGDVTEMGMCRTFLKKKGRGLYFDNFKNLFEHDNSDHEPGLFRPEKIKTKKYSDIAPLYWLYLKFKTLKESVAFIVSK